MYKVERLERTQDSNGEWEAFLSIQIYDELGVYNFATWLLDDEFDEIDGVWTKYSEFKKTDKFAALDPIVQTYLPHAKIVKQQEMDAAKAALNIPKE